MDTLEIVNRIPVNQESRANPQLKSYLLAKIKEIRENRRVIEQAARKKKREDILDAYKKSVGYDKIEARMKELNIELQELEDKAINLGIDPSCNNIIQFGEHDDRVYLSSKSKFIIISQEQRERLTEVKKLLKAVEKEVTTFAPMDVLEMRMMMSSTVGEAMAIVNAVAGRDAFKVELGPLKIEDEKEKPKTEKKAKKPRRRSSS